MPIKIRGLYFDNARAAQRSIARISSSRMSDKIKLKNAELIRQLALLHAKKSRNPIERRGFREAARIYTIFIDTIKKGAKEQRRGFE